MTEWLNWIEKKDHSTNISSKWFSYFELRVAFDGRRQWHPTPVLLPGKSHEWRSLVGCSPRSREESDMTKWLHFHFSLSCTGEGNGNPLQCSCLESPRDGGAWWAAVYGVAQSRTRLKWLSSSSLWWYRACWKPWKEPSSGKGRLMYYRQFFIYLLQFN